MIASADFWQKLQRDGRLFCDPELIYADFQTAYDWMRKQMAKRLPDYQGHYPWWAWVQWEAGRPRPDLRARRLHGGFEPGSQCVRLELDVPEREVLCSDFGEWHIVLNDGYNSLNEAESDAWYQLPPEQQTREAQEASWERIFDLEHTGADPEWAGESGRIQAVFEVLRLADVRRVTHFRARPDKGASEVYRRQQAMQAKAEEAASR